jgi:nucleoid-associated protein YgaU
VRGRVASAALAAAAVLLVAGRGPLAPPPADPSRWAAWVDERGTVAAAVALVRLGALVVALWLAVVLGIAMLGRVTGAARVAAAADRALPAPLRRAVAGAVLVAAGGGCGAAVADAPAGEALVLLPADEPGTAVMRVLDGDEPAPPAPPAPPAQATAEPTWVVAPGDSFWSIAEDVVADTVGRPPSDGEVTRYWRTLVDRNRDRLVSGDPDLLHPGQVLALPPVT